MLLNPTVQLQQAIAELCEDLQRSSLTAWQLDTNSLWHNAAFGGSKLTVLPDEEGNIQATCKTWAVHYSPLGPAVYQHRTVFEVEAKTLPELRKRLDTQLRQIA
jgi:hypothetical protein